MGQLDVQWARGWSADRIMQEIRERDELIHTLMMEEMEHFDEIATGRVEDTQHAWDESESRIFALKTEIDLLTSLL